jgi:hypothetical protein
MEFKFGKDSNIVPRSIEVPVIINNMLDNNWGKGGVIASFYWNLLKDYRSNSGRKWDNIFFNWEKMLQINDDWIWGNGWADKDVRYQNSMTNGNHTNEIVFNEQNNLICLELADSLPQSPMQGFNIVLPDGEIKRFDDQNYAYYDVMHYIIENNADSSKPRLSTNNIQIMPFVNDDNNPVRSQMTGIGYAVPSDRDDKYACGMRVKMASNNTTNRVSPLAHGKTTTISYFNVVSYQPSDLPNGANTSDADSITLTLPEQTLRSTGYKENDSPSRRVENKFKRDAGNHIRHLTSCVTHYGAFFQFILRKLTTLSFQVLRTERGIQAHSNILLTLSNLVDSTPIGSVIWVPGKLSDIQQQSEGYQLCNGAEVKNDSCAILENIDRLTAYRQWVDKSDNPALKKTNPETGDVTYLTPEMTGRFAMGVGQPSPRDALDKTPAKQFYKKELGKDGIDKVIQTEETLYKHRHIISAAKDPNNGGLINRLNEQSYSTSDRSNWTAFHENTIDFTGESQPMNVVTAYYGGYFYIKVWKRILTETELQLINIK